MKMIIFFFQIRWVLHICQDFNSQDFELIIFGNVSAVQWLIQGGSQGPLSEGLGLPLLYVLLSGLLIFRGKKAKFRGIFRGKFAEKSADFAGFSREESQNSPENRSISRDFSGKKSNFEGFSGANS